MQPHSLWRDCFGFIRFGLTSRVAQLSRGSASRSCPRDFTNIHLACPTIPKNTVPTILSEERKLRLREVRTLQALLLFPVAHLSCTRCLKAAGLEDMKLWASEKLSCTG